MVAEKTLRFQGKNKDLGQLAQQIEQMMKADGYKTQSAPSPAGQVIQAQKAGILRDIITADRAFTILISGQPNDFTVRVGIGKWIQNLAVAVAEAVLLSVLFLAVDVPEMLWTRHIEKEVIQKITQLIG
ncbi:MAG: hypothetical protein WA761_09230 [Thermoplasmata archaeon]